MLCITECESKAHIAQIHSSSLFYLVPIMPFVPIAGLAHVTYIMWAQECASMVANGGLRETRDAQVSIAQGNPTPLSVPLPTGPKASGFP